MREKRQQIRVSVHRRGVAILYVVIASFTLAGFVSLAVDLGRAKLAKGQLNNAAESAARAGAAGLVDNTTVAKATLAAQQNYADGYPVVLQASDIEVGTWDATAHAFTVTAVNPTAVRVTARRTSARGTAINTPFAGILGRSKVDVTAQSIAVYTPVKTTVINVPGKGDPWLAGMPSGTTANWYDASPNCAPTQATGLNLTAGAVLNLGFTGAVSYYPGTQPFDPDGNPGWIINNYMAAGASEHGIADLKAPLTSVVGVFLNDNQPDSTPAPASLDFTTAASRDFSTLSPQLKQPFFIGNGYRADGTTLQNFVVPAGATRFYIGVMDGQQWSDNAGSLTTTVTKPSSISTVK